MQLALQRRGNAAAAAAHFNDINPNNCNHLINGQTKSQELIRIKYLRTKYK